MLTCYSYANKKDAAAKNTFPTVTIKEMPMSHFTVLVIGENPEEQLAPYHEFECTGHDDQHVIDVDKTEDYRQRYAETTTCQLKAPDGTLYEPWADEFYRELTPEEEKKHGPLHAMGSGFGGGLSWRSRDWGDGKGYRPKVQFIPDGYEEVRVPYSELMSFVEYVMDDGVEPVRHGEQPDLKEKHKYGYALLDDAGEVVKVVDRTNPNSKWDWYLLGGRWTGFFTLKQEAQGQLGDPSLVMKHFGYDKPTARKADQCRKGDIDFAAMRAAAEAKASAKYDAVRAAIDPHLPMKTWEEVAGQYINFHDAQDFVPAKEGGIDAAREEYRSQPAVQAFAETEVAKNYFRSSAGDYLIDRDAFIRNAGTASYMTHAVIKDGKWYERGEMGWWGTVHNEKERDAWVEEYAALLDGLPDDTLLSVYDCHI